MDAMQMDRANAQILVNPHAMIMVYASVRIHVQIIAIVMGNASASMNSAVEMKRATNKENPACAEKTNADTLGNTAIKTRQPMLFPVLI